LSAHVLFSALTWLAVAFLSHGFLGVEGFHYDLPNEQMPFGRFFILYTIAFALYLFAIIRVPTFSTNKRNILVVLGGALVFRLILIPSVPVHENDIYRYIWDGKVFVAGINPYKYAPLRASIEPASVDQQNDFEKLKSLRDEDPKFYRRISYKDIPTIYPPLSQFVFAASTSLSPGAIWLMKLIFVFFDMAVVVLIYMVLRLLKENPLYVIVYAWNPLVLKEFANSGHSDALAICCVMAAVYLVLKEKYTFSSACLGLGVLSKFYPLIFIPFFLIQNQYKAFLTCLAVITAGYLPFFVWGQPDPVSVFAGLGTWVQEWSVNGFIFEVVYSLISLFDSDPYILSKIICGSIFTATWFFIFYKKRSVIEKTFWAVIALFLLSPVGDPWYFSWAIPFLCIYRKYSLIALSYLLILSYFEFTRDFGILDLSGFEIDNLLLIQYVPFYSMALLESRLSRYHHQHEYLRNE
jgi:alpha-1,6-mannosyltransferase